MNINIGSVPAADLRPGGHLESPIALPNESDPPLTADRDARGELGSDHRTSAWNPEAFVASLGRSLGIFPASKRNDAEEESFSHEAVPSRADGPGETDCDAEAASLDEEQVAAAEAEADAHYAAEDLKARQRVRLRFAIIGGVSVVAISVAAAVASVGFGVPRPVRAAVAEVGAEATPPVDRALIAPAAKLAGVGPREPSTVPVREMPAKVPEDRLTASLVEEVKSFKDGDGAHADAVGKAPSAPSVIATVGEVGAAPVAPIVPVPVAADPAPVAAVVSSAAAPSVASPADVRVASLRPSDIPVVDGGPAGARITEAQQTEVLSYVTQLATELAGLRDEMAKMRTGERKLEGLVEAKMSDVERRVQIGEASRALDKARAAGAPADEMADHRLTVTPATAAKAGKADPKDVASIAPPPAPALASPDPQPRYKVLAASPGLAMLAQLDRSGDEGSQLQVGVGAALPGFGRVLSIGQKGTAWVVKTDQGSIQ